jgi:hypothetical protein
MVAADGCASSSSNPACGVWAPRAEEVAVAMFGSLTGLGMLICRNEGVCVPVCLCAALYIW